LTGGQIILIDKIESRYENLSETSYPMEELKNQSDYIKDNAYKVAYRVGLLVSGYLMLNQKTLGFNQRMGA